VICDLPVLDGEQVSAASIDPTGRQIVLAPPGTGKTEVVAALVNRLVDDHQLSPTDEIIALSFSRAAVSALRRRVLKSGANAALAVWTLDSFASRLLEELDDSKWQHLAFDDRIVQATALTRDHDLGSDLSIVRHVIVDEIQDVVGVRADFVLALLARLPTTVGFTLLGDPRQSVYNFQLTAGAGTSAERFLEQVRNLGAVEERRLVNNYRARSSDARQIARLGASEASGEVWVREVRARLAEVTYAGESASLAGPVGRWNGTTAFLCRDNGTALIAAAALRGAGLSVATRASAEDSSVASWIGEAFASVTSARISRTETLERLQSVGLDGARAWRLLKSTERDFRVPERLDLRRLAQRIAVRDVPAELLGDDDPIVVSTIHRAKGLEFDNVVLVNPRDLLPGDADEDDAAVAYVALTRARDRIMTMNCELPRGLRKDKRTDRWILCGFQKWQTFGFEVRPVDCSPVGNDRQGVAEAESDYPGVVGRLNRVASSLDEPIWDLMVQHQVVARTTPEFGMLIARRIGSGSSRRRPWPDLTGMAVEGAETVANAAVGANEPMLSRGLRVGGLAELMWGNQESDE
jgi:DNA helicase-2/ATP-dependent DNA helicase PcrA